MHIYEVKSMDMSYKWIFKLVYVQTSFSRCCIFMHSSSLPFTNTRRLNVIKQSENKLYLKLYSSIWFTVRDLRSRTYVQPNFQLVPNQKKSSILFQHISIQLYLPLNLTRISYRNLFLCLEAVKIILQGYIMLSLSKYI